MTMTSPVNPPPVRRRRRRWGLRLLIALLVLVGLLVAADRISLAVAERMAGDTLQRSQNLPQRPDVAIDGFPFLTQLATGNFGRIEVRVNDVPITDQGVTVTLTELHITLHDVRITQNFHHATARTSTATALLSYAELSRVLHVPLSYAGAGRVAARASVTVAGVTVTGTVSALPQLSDASLRFTDPRATVDGAAVPGADAALAAVLDHPIGLANLPFGLHVRALAAHPAGVTVTLTAANLSFQR